MITCPIKHPPRLLSSSLLHTLTVIHSSSVSPNNTEDFDITLELVVVTHTCLSPRFSTSNAQRLQPHFRVDFVIVLANERDGISRRLKAYRESIATLYCLSSRHNTYLALYHSSFSLILQPRLPSRLHSPTLDQGVIVCSRNSATSTFANNCLEGSRLCSPLFTRPFTTPTPSLPPTGWKPRSTWSLLITIRSPHTITQPPK